MIFQFAQELDELGLATNGAGLTIRQRLGEILEGPPCSALFLGECGTGRSSTLDLFVRKAKAHGRVILRRCGRAWLWSHSRTGKLETELWPLLASLEAKRVTLAVDDVADTEPRFQRQLLEAAERAQRGQAIDFLATAHVTFPRLAEQGLFSKVLFDIFEGCTVELPTLRAQPENIEPLVLRLVQKIAGGFAVAAPGIHRQAMQHLQAFSWPGNLRQLRTLLEKLVLQHSEGEITAHDLPGWLLSADSFGLLQAARGRMSLRELERLYIGSVLAMTRGHKSKAAAILGINRKTLASKIRRYKIPS